MIVREAFIRRTGSLCIFCHSLRLCRTLSSPDKDDGADDRNEERDELRSGKNADLSALEVAAPELDDKSSDAVKDEIQCRRLSASLLFMIVIVDEHEAEKKIINARHQLRREQRDAVRCVMRGMKHDARGGIRLDAIAAAREKAADPSESLRERYRFKTDVKILP